MKNNSSRYFGLLLSFLLAAWSAVALPSSAHAAEDQILMAVVAPAEGDWAVYGEQMRTGAKLAVDDINARGGIDGKTISLQFVTDKGDAKGSMVIARKLAAEGVTFVIGHYNSTSSIYAAPIYAKSGVLMVSPSSSNPKFTDDGLWNTIRTSGRDDVQGTVAGAYVVRKFPGKIVAVIDDSTPYGTGLSRTFRAAIKSAGAPEALYRKAKPGQNFRSLAAKLAAAKAEIVFFAGLGRDLGRLITAADKAGLKAQFVSGDGAMTRDLEETGGSVVDGLLVAFSLDDNANPAAQAVLFKLQEYPVGGYTMKSHAAVQVVAKGIEMAATTEPRAVAKAIRSGQPIATVLGPLSFDAKGDRREPDVMMYRWRIGSNGGFPLEPAN